MSEREQVWRERIEWQQWSGLTVAECCEEAGVSVASFYRWKKLLTEPQGSRRLRSTRRTEVQASGPETRASQFVPTALVTWLTMRYIVSPWRNHFPFHATLLSAIN